MFLFIKTEKYDSTTLISRIISIGIGFAILVLAFYIAMEFDPFFCTYQHFFRMRLGFDDYNNFGYLYFGLDGISILFFILTIILAFLCSLFILHEDNYQHKVYLLFIIEGLLLIIFSTIDLLLFYICFEGVLIPMYLLIGTYGSRERKIRASYLFFFYTLGSSILVLLAILQIYNTVGSLSFLDLCFSDKFDDSTEQYFIWFAFFLSFAAKIPMFPFHIWLPEAHVEAPTVGSVLLA
ncbi:MAG: proton-conducting transporter transmembrane domain-containing protein, partial [Methanobacterium sp.]